MSIAGRIADHYRKPGPGVEGPPPQKGVKLFGFVLLTHFWKLVQLNLLFVLFCLPVVTIPAACAGMSRVIMRLLRDGHCFLWTDFISELKASFFKALFPGFVFFLLGIGAYMICNSLHTDTNDLIDTFGYAFMILSFSILFVAGCYAFPMIAYVNITSDAVLKNAFIFAFTGMRRNLLLVLCAGSVILLSVYFLPFTLPLFILIIFAFNQFIVCALVIKPIEKYVVKPPREAKAAAIAS